MGNDYFNDPEFRELIRQYLDFLQNALPEVKANLEDKNYLEVQKFGHNMKGSGGGYGLDEFTDIGAQIERAAMIPDHVVLEGLLTSFEKKLEETVQEFKA
ncbi:MAG: hypothetical protein D6762_08565 [Candidatus Neomarinimicrobiota bacterium]|nr:MAG: hypothetical protein D6762_08565 [Candidatus Neomarinimicrobiota bacterium]